MEAVLGGTRKLLQRDETIRHNRYSELSGVSETTKIVQIRRSIILDALMSEEDASSDDRDKCIQRLHCVLECPRVSTELHSKASPKARRIENRETNFSPKWNDYDVMRNRWSYIKPQTKRLVSENKLIVPTSSYGSLVAVPTLDGQSREIRGAYVDAERFGSSRCFSPHK